jgi:threonine dehydratase
MVASDSVREMDEVLVPLEEVADARARIGDHIHRTPLVTSRTLSQRLGRRVSLKLELWQKTGSFKPRGAFNEVLGLDESDRRQGVVGFSGGNFAQALAYAGSVLGVATKIVMPASTPDNYLDATRGYGAEVELVPTVTDAVARLEAYRAEGRPTLHPFDDPRMWAGNGTLGLEVAEDAPDVTDVFVSIGGGGFILGVTSAIKALLPDARVWGVETRGADTMRRSLDAGERVELEITSIAKTLGAPRVAERAFRLAQQQLEDVVVVDDADAIGALRLLLERAKVLTEPAASCTLPAAEQVADRLGDHVVLVLCGGNVATADLADWHHRFPPTGTTATR